MAGVAPSQALHCSWRSCHRQSIPSSSSIRLCSFPSSAASPSSVLSASSKPNLAVVRANADVEFGARDPFPAELESNFSDKVLGAWDTEHVILIPNSPALSLSQQSCVLPLPESVRSFSLDEARSFLRKVVGWRLTEGQSVLKLTCEWRLKDHESGLELINRITQVSEREKKPLVLNLDDATHILRAEIWTDSLGGLCLNDFILAAKIDQVKTNDLVKKNKFWA